MPQDVLNQISKDYIGDVGAGPLRRAPMDIDGHQRQIWAFNDFMATEDYASGGNPWTETDIGTSGGSIALTPGLPGTLVIDCGVTTQKGFQTQLTGSPLSARSGFIVPNNLIGPTGDGKNCVWGFGARFQVNTVSAGHAFVGMAPTDTSIQDATTGAPSVVGTTCWMGFSLIAGSLKAYSNRNSSVTRTDVIGTLLDATYVDVAIRVVQTSQWASGGTAIDTADGYTEFWVNGKLAIVHNGYNGTTGTLKPSFAAVNGAGAIDLIVDSFYQFVQRRTL